MEIGYFTMPSHPPERGLKDGHDWDLQVLRWCDELGYQEAWIGEHHTAPWEPHPAPDLLLAQAFLQTKNIRLGPGGFLKTPPEPADHPMSVPRSVINRLLVWQRSQVVCWQPLHDGLNGCESGYVFERRGRPSTLRHDPLARDADHGSAVIA